MFSDGSASITNVSFRENKADLTGGGLFMYNNATIYNSKFLSNEFGGCGGGLAVWYGNVEIRDFIFSYNQAYCGGGLSLDGPSSGNFTNLTVSFNHAIGSTAAGEVYVINVETWSSFTNLLLLGNTSTYVGGAIIFYGQGPTITNATIVGNTASDSGYVIYNNSVNPALINSILWMNSIEHVEVPGDF